LREKQFVGFPITPDFCRQPYWLVYDKEKFAILELALIAMKGKTEPETVYALLGREEICQ
jgi:hypothetical protein